MVGTHDGNLVNNAVLRKRRNALGNQWRVRAQIPDPYRVIATEERPPARYCREEGEEEQAGYGGWEGVDRGRAPSAAQWEEWGRLVCH